MFSVMILLLGFSTCAVPASAVIVRESPFEITGFMDVLFSKDEAVAGERDFRLGQAELDFFACTSDHSCACVAVAYDPATGTLRFSPAEAAAWEIQKTEWAEYFSGDKPAPGLPAKYIRDPHDLADTGHHLCGVIRLCKSLLECHPSTASDARSTPTLRSTTARSSSPGSNHHPADCARSNSPTTSLNLS